MKESIQNIIESIYPSGLKADEIVLLFNQMLVKEAKVYLDANNIKGYKAIISLFIDY